MAENSSNKADKEKVQKGCSYLLIFIFSIVWLIGVTIASQLMQWLMEQTLFEASFLFPDLRWAIVGAYAALISLPFFMIAFLISDPFMKRVLRFWAILGLTGFLMSPARLVDITNANLVSILQLVAIWTLFMILYVWHFRTEPSQISIDQQRNVSWPVVIAFSALVTIPWVFWGALGSWVDTFLNLLVGFSAAYVFLRIYRHQFVLQKQDESNQVQKAGAFFHGFVVFAGLLVFASTLGQTGQQWMLAFLLPFSSWVISFIYKRPNKQQFVKATVFLGYLFSLPLIWFDADELSLIISSEAGETITWVNRALFATVFIVVMINILVGILKHRNQEINGRYANILSVTAWTAVFLIYFLAGTPGFYGESIFVILNDQIDVSAASQIEDPGERRATVFKQLVDHAQNSQADLLGFLDRFGFRYTSYYLVNAVEVEAGPIMKAYLSRRPDVNRVLDSPYLRPLPEKLDENFGEEPSPDDVLWNIKMLQANRVWQEFGVKGAGIVIGQSDSGVDNHPGLIDQYLGMNEDFAYTWFDPWNGSEIPADLGGHGTHTLGIILGEKTGIAPEANWIGCVNLARNLGNPAYYLDCMQFNFAPHPADGDPMMDGLPEMGAHILNNSWGCPDVEGCDSTVFEQAVRSLRHAGVFVIASAGNSGYYGCESVSDPLAIYDEVLSIGAIDEGGDLAPFSSLGPVIVDGSGRTKPDLVAPGVEIVSTMPGGTYAKFSGTSMAGPHVAGVVALMWSANPGLIGDVERTEQILFDTADRFEGIYPLCIGQIQTPNNAVGYGVVNAYKAVEAAMEIE